MFITYTIHEVKEIYISTLEDYNKAPDIIQELATVNLKSINLRECYERAEANQKMFIDYKIVVKL